MDNIKKNISFKLIYMLIGIIAGLILLMLPLKYGIILIGGIGFVIFSFFHLEVSIGLFIAVMACAPNEYWNNIYIFLGAVFYAGVYAIQYFSGKRKGIDLKYLAPSLIIYVMLSVISLFTGFGGMDSVRVFIILLGCIILSVLVTNIIKDEKILNTITLLITCAITLSALYGIYRYMTGIEIRSEFVDLTKSQGLSRLISVMANSNNDSEFWAMTIPFSIAFIFTTKSDLKRLIVAGMTGICILALVLTYSRAGYIAFIAAAAIFIFLTAPRLIPVCLVVAIALIPFLPSSIIDRVMTIGKDTSSSYRMLIWEGSYNMAKDYLIQGIGMGPVAFSTIYREYALGIAKNAMHAHNVFLNIWVEVGIGGLIAMILYVFRMFKSGISAVYNSKSKTCKYYGAAAVASLTAFMVFSMVEYVWFYPRVMLCFWLVCGITTAIVKINGGKE